MMKSIDFRTLLGNLPQVYLLFREELFKATSLVTL